LPVDKISHDKYGEKNTPSEHVQHPIEIVERDNIDTPNIYIHEYSLSWLSTGTSIDKNVCEGRLVYWVQTSSLCEMMRPCAIHQISAQNYILVKFKFNIQYGGLVHHIFSQVLPKKH
jgi:hypothetical protein